MHGPSINAASLGVGRRTIVRDLAQMKPSIDAIADQLTRAQVKLEKLMPVEKRIEGYVEFVNLAKKTNQPAAGASILTRMDVISGIVPEVERIRAHKDTPLQPQAMFMLPAGTNVSVTVNTSKQQDLRVINAKVETTDSGE